MTTQTETPATEGAVEITLEETWTMYGYDGLVHAFTGPDPFTAYGRSNYGKNNPNMIAHIQFSLKGTNSSLVYDEKKRMWYNQKNTSNVVNYINHSPSNPQLDCSYTRVQLGRRIADLYLAAQHVNLEASNAACDLIGKLGALERYGFNQIMAKTEYHVRAEAPIE